MFRRKRKLEDFTEEIESHVQLESERLVEQGLSPEEARATARRAFGNITAARERFYEAGRWIWWDRLWLDIRFGLRVVRKSPGFTVVAVLALALGIGLPTVLYASISSLLFPRLPYPHPEQLVVLRHAPAVLTSEGKGPSPVLDWASQIHALQSATWYYPPGEIGFNLEGDRPEHVSAARVLPNFFDTLGVGLIAGPGFSRGPNLAAARQQVVLSYRVWKADFGGRMNVIGRRIILNGWEYTVVGIAPRWFGFPAGAEVWISLVLGAGPGLGPVVYYGGVAMGRLANGVSLAEARAELEGFSRRLQALTGSHWGSGVRVPIQAVPLAGYDAASLRDTLLLLFCAAGLVLLIACANVANMNLSRVANRAREFSIRMTVGAGRREVLRQLLVENLLLCLLGGSAGVLLAFGGVALVKYFGQSALPRSASIHFDYRVFAFALAVSLLAAIGSGLPLALRGMSVDPARPLQEGSHGQSLASQHRRLGKAFVVAQVAVALMLVIGSGLLIRSLVRVLDVPLGFQPDHVLTAVSWPASPYYGRDDHVNIYWEKLLDRVRRIPGVEAAEATTYLPLQRQSPFSQAWFSSVTPGYLQTMRIRLITGRSFTWADNAGAPNVAIVSQSYAARYRPHESPLGKEIEVAGARAPCEVVGVVADVKMSGPEGQGPGMQVYTPFEQSGLSLTTLVVRSRVDTAVLTGMVRSAASAVDPTVPLFDVETMDERLSDVLSRRTIIVSLLGVMAALALLLGAIGIGAVVSYQVASRTREFGIRLALGAQPGGLLRMVLRESMRLCAVGIALGLAGAFSLAHLLKAFLFGISAEDPITFASVVVILGAVALASSYLPARRAARVDPVTALKYE